jgi:hypothetical protein
VALSADDQAKFKLLVGDSISPQLSERSPLVIANIANNDNLPTAQPSQQTPEHQPQAPKQPNRANLTKNFCYAIL